MLTALRIDACPGSDSMGMIGDETSGCDQDMVPEGHRMAHIKLNASADENHFSHTEFCARLRDLDVNLMFELTARAADKTRGVPNDTTRANPCLLAKPGSSPAPPASAQTVTKHPQETHAERPSVDDPGAEPVTSN
jgi:hypothetical protein